MPTVRRFRITINGKVYEVEAEELGTEAAAAPQKARELAPVASREKKGATPAAPASSNGGAEVEAPLPGLVLDVKVAEGDAVDAGEVLIILEAMKMENEIVAPENGVVAAVRVAKGDNVSAGDIMVVLR